MPRLPAEAVARIVACFEAAGARAKVSSIHVNGWFGDYDKLTMTRRLFRDGWQADLDALRGECVFVGDSPNDQPMFAFFPHSVGVANVAAFAAQMIHLPAYVTRPERAGTGLPNWRICCWGELPSAPDGVHMTGDSGDLSRRIAVDLPARVR